MFNRFSIQLVTSLVIVSLSLSLHTDAADELTFNRDIRPIFADKCFACHGADSATREAGLRLDLREEAIDFGAFVPGDAAASELIARINLAADEDGVMPPKKSHKELSASEKETLTRWISDGAKYQPHWSFIAPSRPELPPVKNTQWVRNPIDRFILNRLETEGLQPSPPADRRTLARRASLDITGLPPDPSLVDEFVNDGSPDAYDKYLDKLFSLATWGEHRGRYWLDYARYADTHGIHFDNFREIWAYRDWVINAFNRNLPYDQFSIEQLAGDLLPGATLDQLVATGFNRCNMTTNEGGIIDEEYAVLYARDRTETTSAVWLGLTTGCAVCHDHKFDPLTMKDFYSMSAFFNNTTQAVRDGNIPNTPPIVVVPIAEDRQRWRELDELIPEAEKQLANLKLATREKLATVGLTGPAISKTIPHNENLVLHAPLAEGNGDTTSVLIDGRIVPITSTAALAWDEGQTGPKSIVGSDNTRLAIPGIGDFDLSDPFTAAAWVFPTRGDITGSIVACMEKPDSFRGWDLWMNGGRLATHFVNKWPERAIKIISNELVPVNQWSHVAVVNEGSGNADGIRLFVNGKEQKNRELANNSLGTTAQDRTIRASVPLTIARRFADSPANGLRVNDLRLYNASLSGAAINQIGSASAAVYAASLPGESLQGARGDALTTWYLENQSPEYRQSSDALTRVRAEHEAIRTRGTVAHVMNEKPEPAIAFLLNRGEYDQRLDQVSANTPSSLPPLGERSPNRLGLAQWLFSDDHPLTARVTVNRFWQEVFGTGIVRTSGDFGVTGEMPSHPELLDYLAVEFRDGGWDVQALFRLMLTSATYQQAATVSDVAAANDPENRLLSHGPRFRMDAEMVRDMAIWSGGLLSPKIGGPSVRPYQPPGVWEAVAMPESNTRNYNQDEGAALYRRSMYTFWKRAAPPASMEILGAPSREVCTVRRERSNTPLQALVTLNDPQFVEASRKLANMTLTSGPSDDAAKLQFIASRLLSRPLDDRELKILTAALTELTSHYESKPEDAEALLTVGQAEANKNIPASSLAAWTMIASEMMNLDETLCK